MAVNLTNADNALKTVYLDVITEQLNNSANAFLASIEKSTEDVCGKEVKKLVIHGMNGGIGAGTEDGNLPKADGNKYLQLTSPLKNLYGVIEISDKAIRASENNSGAFVSLLNAEMEGLIRSSVYNFNRMLFGSGDGIIAIYDGALDDSLIIYDLKNIYEGMYIDVYDNNNTLVVGGTRINIVDKVNKTIRIDKVIESGVTETGYIVIQGSKNKEITGLGAIFDENRNELYGVDRSSNDWMKPSISKSTGTITEEKIQKMLDEIEEKSGSQTNLIICSWGVRRALMKLFAENKRMVNTVELQGGFKAISYNGIPIVVDKFCPKGTMYFLNTDHFALHQLCDWQWLEGDDGKVLKQIPGKPVYTATLVKYAELLCSCPCGQGMLVGITEA